MVRRAHFFRESERAEGMATCVHCKLERRKLLTLQQDGEPIWRSAVVLLYRPRGMKFWTTRHERCGVFRASTVTT